MDVEQQRDHPVLVATAIRSHSAFAIWNSVALEGSISKDFIGPPSGGMTAPVTRADSVSQRIEEMFWYRLTVCLREPERHANLKIEAQSVTYFTRGTVAVRASSARAIWIAVLFSSAATLAIFSDSFASSAFNA